MSRQGTAGQGAAGQGSARLGKARQKPDIGFPVSGFFYACRVDAYKPNWVDAYKPNWVDAYKPNWVDLCIWFRQGFFPSLRAGIPP